MRSRSSSSAARACPPVTCAVVHPCDRDSLAGPIEAAKRGLIVPVLVGPEAKIRAVARAEGIDVSPYQIVAVEHSHAAAEKAVELARAGHVDALMKGSLHTDELMAAVVPSATGLRTARRISHVFVMDVPAYPRLLLVTDAAINLLPDARGQGRYLPERDRPRAHPRHREAESRDPVRGRDDQSEDSRDARRCRAVQDGRPRPDHRRPARRAARVRQRDLGRGGAHEDDRLAGRRPARTSCSSPISKPAT